MFKRIFFSIIIFSFISINYSFCQQNLSGEEQGWIKKAEKKEKNGWIFLHIEGKPFERGFQHGYLLAKEIEYAIKITRRIGWWDSGQENKFFVENTLRLFENKIDAEYKEEMEGISAGVKKAGFDFSYGDILLLNASIEIYDYWYPKYKDNFVPSTQLSGCSSFIATGKSTKDNKIVLAHNTWCSYINAYCNLILDILPEKGYRILMQAYPGAIHSGLDFFIASSGIIGSETTIGGFKGFDTLGLPEFTRIRKTMQYANTIDDCFKIMLDGNNGGYANTWLFGDTKTNEIGRLELGLVHHKTEKTFDGYFTGSNITLDINILRDETDDSYDDIRNSNIARKVRWKQLFDKYVGKIDCDLGKTFLADHYDVYQKQNIPGARTLCGHCDLDPAKLPGKGDKPFDPLGAVDGKIVDSKMAKEMKFWAKWGSSCNIPFNAKKFLKENPQYDYLEGYLKDRPAKPWTVFEAKK
jgi:hypothetical protein